MKTIRLGYGPRMLLVVLISILLAGLLAISLAETVIQRHDPVIFGGMVLIFSPAAFWCWPRLRRWLNGHPMRWILCVWLNSVLWTVVALNLPWGFLAALAAAFVLMALSMGFLLSRDVKP